MDVPMENEFDPLFPEQFEERFLSSQFHGLAFDHSPCAVQQARPGQVRLIEVMVNENQFPFPFDLGNLAQLPEALQLSVADFPVRSDGVLHLRVARHRVHPNQDDVPEDLGKGKGVTVRRKEATLEGFMELHAEFLHPAGIIDLPATAGKGQDVFRGMHAAEDIVVTDNNAEPARFCQAGRSKETVRDLKIPPVRIGGNIPGHDDVVHILSRNRVQKASRPAEVEPFVFRAEMEIGDVGDRKS
jgi:hypothetical protein